MSTNRLDTTESNTTNIDTCCTKYFTPAVDVYKTNDNLVALIDMPGVSKGDVTIEVDENNILSVKARQSFDEPSNSVFHEFSKGNFYRAFTLGDEYNRDAITASLDNGVLEITIARKEEQKPKRIEITL